MAVQPARTSCRPIRLAVGLVLLSLLSAGCLRGPAENAGLQFGYALAPDPLADDPLYGAIVDLDASIVTPENHTKWGLIHPEPDVYDFTLADQIVSTAQANGQSVRGHVLVWHSQLPSWITDATWTRDELIDVMEDHITTVVSHFRDNFPGVVTQWDVVNEAFYPDGSRRSTIFQDVIGDDYIDLAFQFAHAADPSVELFYNDFYDNSLLALESAINGYPGGPGATPTRSSCAEVPKCAATETLASQLLSDGVPVDGIGFQGHQFTTTPPDYAELAAWTDQLGLEWAVTELDVALPAGGDTPEALTAQASAVRSVVDDCLSAHNCDTVVMWGVTDAYSWIPGLTFGALDHGLLYDHTGVPKPALLAVHDLLVDAGT